MIQRIQTIWLFFITVFLSVAIFIMKKYFSSLAGTAKLFLIIEDGLIIMLSFMTVFFYKNRLLQVIICFFIFVLLFFFFITLLLCKLWAMLVFPFIAIFVNVFAILAIRKDEKLVRSLDRLR